MTHTFEIGKTYTTRFDSNYDHVVEATIIKKTAKFITVSIYGVVTRHKLNNYDNKESFFCTSLYFIAK